MTVIDAIKKRRSVRNYDKKDLSPDLINLIKDHIDNSEKGPFGNKARFQLIEKRSVANNEKVKLGTYGFISNANYFIAGAIEKFEFSEVDYGYLLEKTILELTKKGLATCWLGGTFKRKEYAKLLNPDEKEVIPAISPVGFPNPKKSLIEKLGLDISNNNKRIPFKQLFFDANTKKPLKYSKNDEYSQALEMLRLAPSSVNKQPWRVLKADNKYHFYLRRYNSLSFNKTVDLQKVDMGIALAHFHLTVKHFNKSGIWHIKDPEISEMEYIITWIAED